MFSKTLLFTWNGPMNGQMNEKLEEIENQKNIIKKPISKPPAQQIFIEIKEK